MEAIRISLSYLFTAISASIVVSTVLYLIDSVIDKRVETAAAKIRTRKAQMLAAGIAAFTGGLLCSQFYMLITTKYFSPDGTTPVFPLAVIAGVLAISGAIIEARMLRPRRVPILIWLFAVTVAVIVLVGIRVLWL